METRYPAHPEEFKTYTTERLRKEYLIENLFEPGKVNLVYSHVDRIIVGGICPTGRSLQLEAGKELGVEFFLERRELGVINMGAKGIVTIEGKEFVLEPCDGLYVGMETKDVFFTSSDSEDPAKYYLISAPAHTPYPTVKISTSDAQQLHIGSQEASNRRTIYQMIHPAVLRSCQLVMGMTILEPGNVWNTMPCHTHERRMEVYAYFDLPEDGVVFHFTGESTETRHLVVRNEQAVISPSYSIHSGVGTTNYTFIWGMAGENQTFDDMDHVPMNVLR